MPGSLEYSKQLVLLVEQRVPTAACTSQFAARLPGWRSAVERVQGAPRLRQLALELLEGVNLGALVSSLGMSTERRQAFMDSMAGLAAGATLGAEAIGDLAEAALDAVAPLLPRRKQQRQMQPSEMARLHEQYLT